MCIYIYIYIYTVTLNEKRKEEGGPADVQSLDLVDPPILLQNVFEHACHQTRRLHPAFIREPDRHTRCLPQCLLLNLLLRFLRVVHLGRSTCHAMSGWGGVVN